jgi:hypothetical protein
LEKKKKKKKSLIISKAYEAKVNLITKKFQPSFFFLFFQFCEIKKFMKFSTQKKKEKKRDQTYTSFFPKNKLTKKRQILSEFFF